MRLTLNDSRVEHGGERSRVRRRVVHAGEHHVLDEDLPPAQLDVAAALGEHVGERVAVVHRHQLGALRGIGGVDREREADRLLDLVHEAAQARASSRPWRSSCAGG